MTSSDDPQSLPPSSHGNTTGPSPDPGEPPLAGAPNGDLAPARGIIKAILVGAVVWIVVVILLVWVVF